ncbi:hypothetical protein [Streptomyces venezuelae]|uniref:Uncharacterized protein n=1 Tax=Streptomyces venezuelae (strain ATCC 10712 / CBS 650.69 / DSM 40230 / JCM 4526 / NBRC 13096 / PD 04745) TaxID=953739 RepID=F2R830_STRVP|nr:hypothetical protein SVEN_5553 [Streptomyces venezuelae ATCC 10712]
MSTGTRVAVEKRLELDELVQNLLASVEVLRPGEDEGRTAPPRLTDIAEPRADDVRSPSGHWSLRGP